MPTYITYCDEHRSYFLQQIEKDVYEIMTGLDIWGTLAIKNDIVFIKICGKTYIKKLNEVTLY